MRKVVAVSLVLGMSFSAFAGEKFGGIDFHSDLPTSQVRALKADLSYLFKTPVTTVDAEFQKTAELVKVDGPHMHNWIFNRVKHIVDEGYELNTRNVVTKTGHQFPTTPFPDIAEQKNVVTVMSNLGSAVYLVGKSSNVLYGLRLDGAVVYGKSTRVGILQVGEGLFHEKFAINKNPLSAANSVSRLGTLFHEARHSDGNSKHTGFIHNKCPRGHSFEGSHACEVSSNGSYSVGALAQRNLLKNCSTCSVTDKSVLSASIADSFNRIVVETNDSRIKVIQREIEVSKELLKSYELILQVLPNLDTYRKAEIHKEIASIKARIVELNKELAQRTANSTNKPKALDPKPEGEYKEVSVMESSKVMTRSLR